MTLIDKVQSFLKKKLKEHNLKPKSFAQESGIPYPTINKIINAVQRNPELKNILKIANYFNCSVDEILARKNYYLRSQKYSFNNVSLDGINFNLKNFINDKLAKNEFNAYKLSQLIGFSEHPISDFLKDKNRNLNILIILALADYFKVSIDEMIGRVTTSNQKLQ